VKTILSQTVFVLISVFLLSAEDEYWQQFVHYSMDVSLNPVEHLISGKSSIVYVNHSPDTLDRIYMHLYPNAFLHGSVKYEESSNYGVVSKFMLKSFPDDSSSYLRIDDFAVASTEEGTSRTFEIDDTILQAPLPAPLLPGDSVTIEIDWEHKVRKFYGRAGYRDEQYDVAQWYPKMVVYDETGWHPDPFHAMGEFYGEFGTYDVIIDVPERFTVAATGVLTAGDPGWSRVAVDTSMDFQEWLAVIDSIEIDSSARRTMTFHGKQVHDFAWIASPDFVYEDGQWGGIDIHVLYDRDSAEDWSKEVVKRTKRVLEWLSTRFGEYPYPQVSITHSLQGGGMEYPMLVMDGSDSEGLIAHEVGHIWFYGILANNEVEEAWLDEGFTSFQDAWYMAHTYPPHGIDLEHSRWYGDFEKKYWQFLGERNNVQWTIIRFMTSRHNEPIDTKSYLASGWSAYGLNAYTKPHMMLYSLRNLLGGETFDSAMQNYYHRWKLKHTNEDRFRQAMEETSGENLDWFFEQWLHQASYNDYALGDWWMKKGDNGTYDLSLRIEKKGGMRYPLDIRVVTENGDTTFTRWTNHLRGDEDIFSLVLPSKPVDIMIDPDNWTMDIDLRDNVSGSLPDDVIFNWPGMGYNPRAAYVLRWNPVFWYHEKDGLKPGLSFRRSYGPWHRFNFFLTSGLKSQNLYGQINFSETLKSFIPWLTVSANVFFLEGLRGGDVDFSYGWSRFYGLPPNHTVTAGFYFNQAGNSGYTDLYQPGETGVLYGRYGVGVHRGGMGRELQLEAATSVEGMSDWSFSRLQAKGKMKFPVGKLGTALSFFLGKVWGGAKGVPGQEKFTVESAGSGDYYAKPYLRHASAFYGVEAARNHFHINGEGNLRGYYDHDFSGAETVLAATFEGNYSLPTPAVKTRMRIFVEGGSFRSELASDGLNGDILADVGAGFVFSKKIAGKTWRLRMDFPFWLNHTANPAGREIKSLDLTRWVIGFDGGL
jgi:hypothetical protein|tara:strand:+ start:7456 stop:10407 length:2952 start_codon:yes stop_codon:yes gene_type:complete